MVAQVAVGALPFVRSAGRTVSAAASAAHATSASGVSLASGSWGLMGWISQEVCGLTRDVLMCLILANVFVWFGI